ncbi:MAG: amino acid ABC transporter permease, partial [Alphaproteobacteria bacterium]|nr:amino acid ABC transporter permease [Alphaproteobacteria bacterium]
MTDATTQDLPVAEEIRPPRTHGIIAWLRANLFSNIFNSLLTLLALYILVMAVPPLVRWGLVDAVWSAPNGQACRAASGDAGACWAFIGAKVRFILFGRYPYDEQWRPSVVVLIFLVMLGASCNQRWWGRPLIGLWVVGLAAAFILMGGGILGLSAVDTLLWNGLPLTLILAV